MQELVSSLVSSILAGERAIFYALNFDLQPYKVHDLVMELSDGGLDRQFCASPQGRNLFKTAWETVVFGCEPCCKWLCLMAVLLQWSHLARIARSATFAFCSLPAPHGRKQGGRTHAEDVSQQRSPHYLWMRNQSAAHLKVHMHLRSTPLQELHT